jgi:Na+/H+ antiporter NhaC
MQFLADNWYFFVAAWVFFLVLLVLNFVKMSKDTMRLNADGFQGGIARHLILGLLSILSAIPAVIGVILAIIKFAQAN